MVEQFYWSIVCTLTGITNPGQSRPGSNGDKEVLYISQSSRTGVSPSDCLMLYPGHPGGGYYPSAESQSAYSTAPAD